MGVSRQEYWSGLPVPSPKNGPEYGLKINDHQLFFSFLIIVMLRGVWKKEMATHSSILAWRIPGTEEPGGLPSVGSHRVGHN